ncbi:uncharacterized protein LOC113233118 [Hyposmocoma kahamanoa]|uniref:uncharacterized protein LOC113233118 n=1 Tax=Hyposmocoma kahamanoa TaxID=1477025 RepID=UPI000E6D7A4B|nr:uncharacterized protein LOC113233118 [Hyposmocoma kahamanoa]
MTNSDTQLLLIARNEGKIKSYESCIDVRAWSHDVATQVRYLKEWMRCDMPVCVIPMSTVLGFLRIMTCSSRSRAAPRCHPDCKSKIILESITNSCEAMKECLKEGEDLEKFFIEDEFETSHWPCDRCLEALKSIKLFWKVLLEKLFNLNISKTSNFSKDNCVNDSSREVARNWQQEMVRQALFVKSLMPCSSSSSRKKRELQKVCDEGKWRESSYCPKLLPVNENPRSLLHNFEESVYETSKVAKDAESEMIITLQNCKNDTYQHVSLLQVLHKTNDPILQEVLPHGPRVKKEDPVCLLTKVQKALGEMVKREMKLASKTKKCTDSNISDIEASFRTVAVCKSKNWHSSPSSLR